MRKKYYEWTHVTGAKYWQPKGVHDYLQKGDLNRHYMKMIAWTGKAKLMTKQEHIETKLRRVHEIEN